MRIAMLLTGAEVNEKFFRATEEELKGRRRRLVVVAAVLALLEPLDGALRRVGVEVDSGALGAAHDRALAGQL